MNTSIPHISTCIICYATLLNMNQIIFNDKYMNQILRRLTPNIYKSQKEEDYKQVVGHQTVL